MTTAIATELGIQNLPLEEQQALISQFGEVAIKAASLAVIERLPEEKREQFAQLAAAGDPTAIKIFLDAELPEHDSIARGAVAEEVRRFKELQTA